MKELKLKSKEMCCVCGHPLSYHFDEGDGWRCPFLGGDFYQCECFLRKNRAKGDISYYDLEKRQNEQFKELKEVLKG
jgi:hypothetical protein